MRAPSLLVAVALVSACSSSEGQPPPDARAPDAPTDALDPPCIALGCPVPDCTSDPTTCLCNGARCVTTGIPVPTRCADLGCVALACGLGDEALLCQCELASGAYQTCLAE